MSEELLSVSLPSHEATTTHTDPLEDDRDVIKAQFIPNQKMPNFPLSFSVISYCRSVFLFTFSALSNYTDVCFLFKKMEKDVTSLVELESLNALESQLAVDFLFMNKWVSL